MALKILYNLLLKGEIESNLQVECSQVEPLVDYSDRNQVQFLCFVLTMF